MRTFPEFSSLKNLCAAILMLICLLLTEFQPEPTAITSQSTEIFTGWVSNFLQVAAAIIPLQWYTAITLTIFALITTATLFRAVPLDQASPRGLMSFTLILTNPLILWCAQETVTLALPALSILLWLTCQRLQRDSFALSSIATGLMLALYVLATPTGLLSAPALFALIILLLPLKILHEHAMTAFGILLAPILFVSLSMAYWHSVTGSGLPVFLPETPQAIINDWQHRNQGLAGTTFGEFLLWSAWLAPGLIMGVITPQQHSHRRLALFFLGVPLVTAVLATDSGFTASPLPYLVMIVSAHAVFIGSKETRYDLATLGVSWLGSFLAIWYYAL